MSSTLPPGAQNYVVFGPNANCTFEVCSIEMTVFGYRPNLAANAVFLALFATAGFIHLYLGLRWRTWFFMICMQLGCLSAVIGYAGRIMMYNNPWSFTAFMMQIICVGTAPVYYCAAIYVTLASTVTYLSPETSRFPPKLFYWVFIPCDILSLVLQAAGGGLSTSTKGSSRLGVDMSLAGLGFQVFTILIFCALFADYLVRYYRSTEAAAFGGRLGVFFGFLGSAVVLITARSVYRVVELHEGYSGRYIKDEGLFIGLEGVLIVLSVFFLMFGHPGRVFNISKGVQVRVEEGHKMTFGK